MIHLYTASTPNGWKVSVTLEEIGMAYETHSINLGEGEQKKEEFLALNPNGRIPTLIDHEAGDFAVFESGAILLYLAEKYDRFIPADAQARSQVIQWVMWQMGGAGPIRVRPPLTADHFSIGPSWLASSATPLPRSIDEPPPTATMPSQPCSW